jgi:hypothetical protein
MSESISPEKYTLAFLHMLDPNPKAFAFRLLPETEEAKRSVKASNHVGGIAELRRILAQKNGQSCGVFVTINEGGQRANEITRVRAVFADTDGAPLEPIKATLQPHIIVETSPSRWHVYWLVADGFPLDQFSIVQTAIAKKFGTDLSVKDLPRIMRVPGFYHQKQEPYLCRVVALSRRLQRYSLEGLVHGLGLDLNAPTRSEIASRLNAENGPQVSFTEVERALSYLNPFVPRDEWIRHIWALKHEFGEAGRELAHRWSRGDLWAGWRDGNA